MDSSIKDGYAVLSVDVEQASLENPRTLKVIGRVAAGEKTNISLTSGVAVKVMAGAALPKGTQAVVSQEFTRQRGDEVQVFIDAEPGRNILFKGSDVKAGMVILSKGQRLRPSRVGFLASAGLDSARVYRRSRVAVIATGSEVLGPGQPTSPRKIFASNLVNIGAWLKSFGIKVKTAVVEDREEEITQTIINHINWADAILTSGGAWKGERDMVVKILDRMRWHKIYHRVRMGPGKAIGFGLLRKKPIFCLPGGPPSNEMAFIQLALPGILRLGGSREPPFPFIKANCTMALTGQADWTQFIYARLNKVDEKILVEPISLKSRLQGMADASSIICIPERQNRLEKNQLIDVQLLNSEDLMHPFPTPLT